MKIPNFLLYLLFKIFDEFVDLTTATILNSTCFIKVSNKYFKYITYNKQGLGRFTFCNYIVTTISFFVITIHYVNIVLTPTVTKKREPEIVSSSENCSKAFSELKEMLLSYPVLKNVSFSLPFTLQVDASNVGVGAVLSQPDEQGLAHPVAYFSRKLLLREKKFSVIEKGCLAIKLGVEAFLFVLIGKTVHPSDGPPITEVASQFSKPKQ